MKTGVRRRVLLALLAVTVVLGVANVPVTTKQGVNYQISTHTLPLYIKGFEFLDRHAHYRQIASEVAAGRVNDSERVTAAFDWTHRNIRPTPDGWPIIDDHILNIVIRGHGTHDQRADVFTLLVSYAGVPAFWHRVRAPDGKDGTILSFARVDGRWVAIDIGHGFLFRNGKGALASAEELSADLSLLPPAARTLVVRTTPYSQMFINLRTPPVPRPLRAELQMPGPRIWYETKHAVGLEHDNGAER